ncbi:LDCC motif putative metal-binding protein [Clostridium sp. ZS2-4]|nr:LDCC motif putative metal-binding protein [Clostridium sp. ZS2-4]MCY6356176.1 LDCC motif putative metal-binding protein [Clostridium sp. ZS2-4]
MKKWFNNFIKKIAEENKKSLGTGKLDCCGLNKTTNIKKTKNKK